MDFKEKDPVGFKVGELVLCHRDDYIINGHIPGKNKEFLVTSIDGEDKFLIDRSSLTEDNLF